MTTLTLPACKILVVEDDWHIADDLAVGLELAGGTVVGPFGTLKEGHRALEDAANRPDLLITDITLRDDSAYPSIDAAFRLGVPCFVTSGYANLPEPYGYLRLLQKPVSRAMAINAVLQLLGRSPTSR